MTKRKYNKIIKWLDKIMLLLREEEVNYKRKDYAEVKIEIYKAYKKLKNNEYWWITKK